MPHQTTHFGRLLRETRRRTGLSQAELGGDRYSGSYISHLESGRRAATPEVVEFLSQRLGVTPLELGIEPLRGAALAAVDSDTRTLETLLVAERAWHDRDWTAAAAHAARAADSAFRAGQPERHWEALYIQAQARFADADFAGCAELATRLAEHQMAARSPVLRAQALSLASVAYRASDRLGLAIAFGGRAVEVAEESPPIILAEALMALVSALSEAGLPASESETYRRRLADVSLSVESDHARGMICWSLGTAAMRAGDIDTGMALHAQAQRLLSSKRDVRQWLRLQRTVASCRLDAGISEGVAELLDVARAGLEVVGNASDVVELRQAEARLALLDGRGDQAEALLRGVLADPVLGASELGRARTESLLAECRFAAGDRAGAAAGFASAARQFEAAGLFKRAVEAWRRSADLGCDKDLTELSSHD